MLASTARYQWRAQGPSVARRPAGQRSMAGSEPIAERLAQRRQDRLGRASIGRVDHRRRLSEPVGLALEEIGLLLQPEILEGRALALPEIGGDHPRRLADQEGVGEACEIVDGRPARSYGATYASGTRSAIRPGIGPAACRRCIASRSPSRRRLVAHRMRRSALLQEGAVIRLVADEGVGAVAEASHHRGREIARTGPHRDPERGHQGRPAFATSASMRLR